MHEFSIATNILEIAEDAVNAKNASKVHELVLDIGVFSGVEIVALETALDSIKAGTIFEESEIRINIIQGKAICMHCRHEFTPDHIFDPCPSCGNFGLEVTAGSELKVKTIIAE